MALAVATPTSSAITGTAFTATTTGATGGTGPYTYQYYQSTVSGFTPGASNLVAGATGLSYSPAGLLLGVEYFVKVIATDTGAGNATVTSSQLAVQLLTTPNVAQPMNQFQMAPFLGQVDLLLNTNTMAVQFDPAGSGTINPGQALKWSTTTTGGIPKVVPSTSTSDIVAGFANYNNKKSVWNPGDKFEMSRYGNVMYLVASVAINRGVVCTSTPTGSGGGVGVMTAVTGSSGFQIVAVALDNIAANALGRFQLINFEASWNID